ncbi:hypothetical protein B0H10DRAFT_1947414 [Mycena sp. CBHHK59/15]|nr:hypothetical protein B0H10DRAFT_1947414 [Mycena sp. CBHHK59/15]
MTRNRRAKSLPLNLYRFPKATRHGLTGTKKDMQGAIQAEITQGLEIINQPPDGLLLDHEGHLLTHPIQNTGKKGGGIGVWSQFGRSTPPRGKLPYLGAKSADFLDFSMQAPSGLLPWKKRFFAQVTPPNSTHAKLLDSEWLYMS